MSLYRLTKRERLDNPHQFKNIYNFAAPKKGANFWLYCMPNGLAYNRLGISISKKICASSVGRNKFKRCIRESFRLHKDFFGQGSDLIITLKKKPEIFKHAELEKEILLLGREGSKKSAIKRN